MKCLFPSAKAQKILQCWTYGIICYFYLECIFLIVFSYLSDTNIVIHGTQNTDHKWSLSGMLQCESQLRVNKTSVSGASLQWGCEGGNHCWVTGNWNPAALVIWRKQQSHFSALHSFQHFIFLWYEREHSDCKRFYFSLYSSCFQRKAYVHKAGCPVKVIGHTNVVSLGLYYVRGKSGDVFSVKDFWK